jgi:hypothetical protein
VGATSTATLTLEGTTSITGSGSVVDDGTITIASGSADIGVAVSGSRALDIDAAATLELGGTSANTITFEGDTGRLILDNPATFTGEIAGFTGTAANAGSSDEIVLSNFNPTTLADTVSYNSSTNITTLTVSDSSNTSLTDTLNFVGDYTNGNTTNDFKFVQNGSNLEIFDPPASANNSANASTSIAATSGDGTTSWFPLGNDQINLVPGQTVTDTYTAAASATATSVSIGGPGNDTFVFAPGVGVDTVVNFNAQSDTIELDHFAVAQTMQQLASLVTTDTHGDAVIELGHNDSITIPGVTATYLQQHLSSLVHLH